MKMSRFALYAGLALMASVSFYTLDVQAQPIPGGNPNCSTNWVGGACGPISNNGYQPNFCERAVNANSCECNRHEKRS